jgi:hypothetical protein
MVVYYRLRVATLDYMMMFKEIFMVVVDINAIALEEDKY